MLATAITALTCCFPAPARAIDDREQLDRLLFESQQLEDEIAKQGLLFGDPQVDAYLQSVIDQLFPEIPGRLRVRVISEEEMNAFALPSGSIYVHTGALLRIRNEAELAALLGHEGAHVVEQHSLESASSGKALANVGLVLTAGLTAAIGWDPLIGQVAAISTMAGFSRSREREADALGIERMRIAGYAPDATAVFFNRVQREFELRKLEKGLYLFATHPRFESRVASAMPDDAAASVGERRRQEYVAATRSARLAALEELRAQRKADALTYLLGEEGMAEEFVPEGHYYLGEGYRLRDKTGDPERAAEQYQISVQQAPEYAPAWGALGRYYMKAGDAAKALTHLERFLQLAPDSREAPFARQTVDRLRQTTATTVNGK